MSKNEKSRFTEFQIVAALKEYEAGKPAAEVCRSLGINKQTFYNWKNKHNGMEAHDLKRLNEFKEKNLRLN